MARLALTVTAPSGESWRLVDALRSLMGPTRQSHGCVSCTLSFATESNDPSSITYTEVWSTDDDLRQHILSDRFPRLLSVMEESLDAPTIEFDLAGGHRGIDYVEEVRRDLGDADP